MYNARGLEFSAANDRLGNTTPRHGTSNMALVGDVVASRWPRRVLSLVSKAYALFLACPFAIGFFTAPLPWANFSSLARALNAWAVIVTLWYSSTSKGQL